MAAPSGNIETLPFMCVIDTLRDLLQETGPNSGICKATSILLNAPASWGDTWSSGLVVCEVVAFILVLGKFPAEQAGCVRVEWCFALNLLWVLCGTSVALSPS